MVDSLKMLVPPLPWETARQRPGPGDRVILLHGLWRSVWAMEPIARRLNQSGFETLSVPYPSFRGSLDSIVEGIAENLEPSGKVTHFVTHSMGGIVLRCLAHRYPELVTGKVVMLAAPNQGSEIIDWLEDCLLARWIFGPGGMSLSTTWVRGRVPFLPNGTELAVIMGSRSLLPAFDFLLQGEKAGIFTVESGRMPGVRFFKVVESDHTLITGRKVVLDLVDDFLDQSG